MNSGIYTITNLINGKIYVGYTNDFSRREAQHQSNLRLEKHQNDHFSKAVKKYGINNFKFEILEECEERFLASQEHYWCTMLNTHNDNFGYNLRPTHPENKSPVRKEVRKRTPVDQYDLKGNFIKTHPSMLSATREIHGSSGHISACCKGERDTAFKYVWRYEGEAFGKPIRSICKRPTLEEVKSMRVLKNNGLTYKELSELFSFSERSISDIVLNKTYKE